MQGDGGNGGNIGERLARLEANVAHLVTSLDSLRQGIEGMNRRLSWIEKSVWTAIGGVAVLAVIVVFVLRPAIGIIVERVLNN